MKTSDLRFTAYILNPYSLEDFNKVWAKNYRQANAQHCLLNNILMGRDFHTGFTLSNRIYKYKLEMLGNSGLYRAATLLLNKRYLLFGLMHNYFSSRRTTVIEKLFDDFLSIYDGLLTRESLYLLLSSSKFPTKKNVISFITSRK